MLKDKRAFLFFFFMTIIFLDFANQLKILSYNKLFLNINNPIFQIVHVKNTGGAFSIFENSAIILAIVGLIVISVITGYIYRQVSFKDKLTLLSSVMFVSGTLGNIIERLKYGYVIDYIKLNFINFPVFNSFDMLICLGVFVYFIDIIIEYAKEKNANN